MYRRKSKVKLNVDLLTLEAEVAKARLDSLTFKIEELTPARELAAEVWNDARTRQDFEPGMLQAAGVLYNLVADELQRVTSLRDQQIPVIESLRQRDIPEVNAALDDLIVGGIRFG